MYVHTRMSTKTISITEKAYNRLASLKKEHESFSVVIERITKKNSLRLKEFHGIISKEFADEIEHTIEKGRKTHKALSEKRHKELIEGLI